MVSFLPMQAFYYAIVNGDEEQFVSDLRGLKREGSRPTVKMECWDDYTCWSRDDSFTAAHTCKTTKRQCGLVCPAKGRPHESVQEIVASVVRCRAGSETCLQDDAVIFSDYHD